MRLLALAAYAVIGVLIVAANVRTFIRIAAGGKVQPIPVDGFRDNESGYMPVRPSWKGIVLLFPGLFLGLAVQRLRRKGSHRKRR